MVMNDISKIQCDKHDYDGRLTAMHLIALYFRNIIHYHVFSQNSYKISNNSWKNNEL